MPVEIVLHGNREFGNSQKAVTFERTFTINNFPQLKTVNNAAHRLRFAVDVPDALKEFRVQNVGELCYFPSLDEIAYWTGATMRLKEATIGILIPKSESAYCKRPQRAPGSFSLNPYDNNQKRPSPFGPILLTRGEISQNDLPEIIEIIGQAFQQFGQKITATLN